MLSIWLIQQCGKIILGLGGNMCELSIWEECTLQLEIEKVLKPIEKKYGVEIDYCYGVKEE